MIHAKVQINILNIFCGIFLILFGFCFSGQAQESTYFGPKHVHKTGEFSDNVRQIKISYNEKVPFETGELPEMEICSWVLTKNDSLIIEGQGCNPIQHYIFTTPGNYELVFDMPGAYTASLGGACFHPVLPGKYLIEVSPYKLTFDPGSFSLSESITSGVETKGILLTINILFESFDGSPLTYDKSIISTGIETTITGSLAEPVELIPGINEITFSLNGKVTHRNTFIGFDFFNNATQSLWSYPLTNPIF
ncbi:MAG: hypothetical protein IPN79_14955 [Saprospiraceae bacterium]|nr:hypothetical protein [Saprospiraceae bacterium]